MGEHTIKHNIHTDNLPIFILVSSIARSWRFRISFRTPSCCLWSHSFAVSTQEELVNSCYGRSTFSWTYIWRPDELIEFVSPFCSQFVSSVNNVYASDNEGMGRMILREWVMKNFVQIEICTMGKFFFELQCFAVVASRLESVE